MHIMSLGIITLLTEHVKRRRQFIIYGIIGLSGATLDVIGYLLLYRKIGITPSIASFISVTVGITNNFLLNLRFNFDVTGNLTKRFLSFYTIGLSGAVFSALAIELMQKGNIDPTVAKLITIPLVVVCQYVLNKRVSFRS